MALSSMVCVPWSNFVIFRSSRASPQVSSTIRVSFPGFDHPPAQRFPPPSSTMRDTWWQVEEFILMPVEEALETIKTDLARWKPNCALVMIDFALRHGFLDPDHPVRDADTGTRHVSRVCVV